MKHALIVAHPNKDSFTMTMALAYAAAVEGKGHAVVLRDLYRMRFDPCLAAQELPWAPDHKIGPDVAAERQLLADVDVFAFVYPFWFNAPPAMLKGYCERVFGAGFGYRPGAFGTEPLLKGRRMISVTASGAPKDWVEASGAMQAERQLFDTHFASVCGLKVVDHLHFGKVVPGMRTDAIEVCAAAVRSAVDHYFSDGQTRRAAAAF